MKNLFITGFLVFASTSLFAQWNNTADSKTTGSLTVGSDVPNSVSKLSILGANSPYNIGGKREISFDFKDAGKSVIRSYRSGGWATNLELLTTDWTGALSPRMRMDENNYTQIFGTVTIGDHFVADSDFKVGEGSRLYFAGAHWNYCEMYMAKYLAKDRYSELRVNIGGNNSGTNKFVIGNKDISTPDVWRYLLSVSDNGNVGIGVENPTNALEVNGTIRAKQVRVETGWADFVFSKEYNLPSLNEVKAHIDEHKHLPGIPTEAEVKENGIDLAEIQVKLLQKVEELTLYAIQQQQTIEKLNSRLQELENTKK